MNTFPTHCRPWNWRRGRLLKQSERTKRQDFESLRRKVERELFYWIGFRARGDITCDTGVLP
jgi:hypothetical protein